MGAGKPFPRCEAGRWLQCGLNQHPTFQMNMHLRIARPVRDLSRAVAQYTQGLGLEELASFTGHAGFDGVMLGLRGADFHFEFTVCRTHPVTPRPTPEDLCVFYIPDPQAWAERCQAMQGAGFKEVESFNPYWRARGCTWEDADGYRVVIQRAAWSPSGLGHG